MRCTWVETILCMDHYEARCDCEPFMKYVRWQLYCDGANHGACVQRFSDDGPYYGTWETDGGGRTGAVTTFEDCKTMVKDAVLRSLRPH